jgi:hypothetical protein
MEVDRTRVGRIPQEERNRRMKDGACFRCGLKGHFSYQCTPQHRAQNQAPPTTPPRNDGLRQGREVRDYRRVAAMERERMDHQVLEDTMGGVSLEDEVKSQGKE